MIVPSMNDVLMWSVCFIEQPMNIYTRECVEPFKPSVPARLALSRVEVIDQLYDKHGLKNRSVYIFIK